MSFAENLRLAMTVRGLTADHLGKLVESPTDAISAYRTRHKSPKWYRVIDIADALNVSLDWMFDRDYVNEQPKEITTLSAMIQELMELCEVTRKDVYTGANISPVTLNRILDDGDAKMESVIKLADYFDTSLDFLAGRGKQSGISQEEIDEYMNY